MQLTLQKWVTLVLNLQKCENSKLKENFFFLSCLDDLKNFQRVNISIENRKRFESLTTTPMIKHNRNIYKQKIASISEMKP